MKMPKYRKKITSIFICRLCLSTEKNMEEIFDNNIYPTASNIMACANIQLAKGDGYPSLICNKCCTKLKIAFDFKHESERSSKLLKKAFSTTQLPNISKEDMASLWSESDDECIKQLKVKETVLSDIIPFENDNSDNEYTGDNINPNGDFIELTNAVTAREDINSISIKQEDQIFEDFNQIDAVEMVRKSKKRQRKKAKQECKSCGKIFKSTAFLAKHVIRIHNNGLPIDTSSHLANDDIVLKHLSEEKQKFKPFICSVCGKCFSQVSNLARHHRCHTGEKPFQCQICFKLFAQLTNLNIHRHVHEETRNYKCEQCPMDFKRPSHLTEHMKTHSSVKEYSCNICGKGFNKSSHLVTHLRVHTGEKPFSCEHCGKSFNDPSNLATHIRIHTGIRPYACRFCNKAYTQKISMIRHEKYHFKLLEQKTGKINNPSNLCEKPMTDEAQKSDKVLTHMYDDASGQQMNCKEFPNKEISRSLNGIELKTASKLDNKFLDNFNVTKFRYKKNNLINKCE